MRISDLSSDVCSSDLVSAVDTVVKKLSLALFAGREERRHVANCNAVCKFDEQLTPVVEHPDRTPVGFVARKAVAKIERGKIEARRDGRGAFAFDCGRAQRNQLLLGIGP